MEGSSYWHRLADRRQARRALLRSGALAGAGISAIGLAGCGGTKSEGNNSGGNSSASTPGSAASSSATGQVQRGGILVRRASSNVQSLDVHSATASASIWPAAACYNQLIRNDPNDPDNKIIPDLADSHEIASDGTSIVFKLHPGIKFHDGSAFTSEDVKANLNWIKSPPPQKASPRQAVLSSLDRVETPDPLTVKLVLTQPNPSLIINLASEYFCIGSQTDLVKGDLGTQYNGTGPFRMKNYTKDVSLELERIPDYWVKDRPYLDGLQWFIIVDENTAFTNFLAGKFHHYYPVAPDSVERVKTETGGKAQVILTLNLSRNHIFFNTQRKPYDDLRVRRAISYAIDRQSALQILYRGYGAPGGYMLPGGQWAISSDQLKKVPGYDKMDVAEGKKLLSAAGVDSLSGSILTNTNQNYKDFATFVQGALKSAYGWNFTIDTQDAAAGDKPAIDGKFDIYPATNAAAADDPDAVFAQFGITTAARNYSKLSDKEADALYEKQSRTLDTAQRKQLSQELELKLLNDHQLVTCFFQKRTDGLYNTVQNYKMSASLYANDRMDEAWLSKA